MSKNLNRPLFLGLIAVATLGIGLVLILTRQKSQEPQIQNQIKQESLNNVQKSNKQDKLNKDNNQNQETELEEYESFGQYENINGQTYFLIKELGVKFPIEEKSKGEFIYSYYGQPVKNGAASFTTKSLFEFEPICESTNSPMGTIVRREGQRKDVIKELTSPGGKSEGRDLEHQWANYKQFDNFFIYFILPQASCFFSEEEYNKADKLGVLNMGFEVKNVEFYEEIR